MSRIIFWLALVFLVIFAIRSKIRQAQKRHQQQFRQPPPPGPQCYTASNVDHVRAGRAHDSFFIARANGSNQNMGLDNIFIISTLRRTGPNHYVLGSCP